MKTKMRIGRVVGATRNFYLDPDQAGGWTYGVLAKKGAGKTYTGRVMAEEMFAAGIQPVILDPTGAWWGLRASADGESDGLSIPIFGGDQGDAPLEQTAGRLMADLAVDEGLAMVLDLSAFGTRVAERRFALDFLDRLYRRNRQLIHLFVDEADVFAPQKPRPGDEPLLGAMQNIIRRGRIKGIGATLISQRPAVISKDVLTQIDVLVSMQITSPQDRLAITAWMGGHEGEDHEMLASLSGLQKGESWWWVPEAGILDRVQIRKSETFDSSPTPKRNETRREPATFADVDMAAVSARISATIEKAKAEDPKELNSRIRELESQLAERPSGQVSDEDRAELYRQGYQTAERIVPVPIANAIDRALDRIGAALERLSAGVTEVENEMLELEQRVAGEDVKSTPAPSSDVKPAPMPRSESQPSPPPPPSSSDPGPARAGSGLPVARQAILDALAVLELIGVHQPARTQVGLLAGASPKSSGFEKNIGALRTAGLVEYPMTGRAQLTAEGREQANSAGAPSTVTEMHAFVRRLVGEAKWALLALLIAEYPRPLTRSDLAEEAGVSVDSSGFEKNIGSLRSLGLIDYPARGQAVALPVLFLET